MANWIYCGSDPPVDAPGTQSLLRTHAAVWCSPPGFRPWPSVPQPGDRLWLLWRDRAGGPVLLLGGGRLARNNQTRYGTDLLHTNRDIPGVREGAENLGYRGGQGMSFLRLGGLMFPRGVQAVVNGLGGIPNGLSEASEPQSVILDDLLQV